MEDRRTEVRRAGDKAPASRAFVHMGVPWQVLEIQTAEGAQCLIFESAHAVRRVHRYPPDWQDLSESELELLSWAR